MDDRTQRRILDWLKRLDQRKLSRSIGMVTDTSPLTVEIAGSEIAGVSKLASYTPSVGHRVYVIRSGRDLTVLGQVG